MRWPKRKQHKYEVGAALSWCVEEGKEYWPVLVQERTWLFGIAPRYTVLVVEDDGHPSTVIAGVPEQALRDE